MKIALLTNGIYPLVVGGMQKHSYYLAKYMARSGVKVDVYHAVEGGQRDAFQDDSLFTEEEVKNIEFIGIERVKRMHFPGHYIRESYLNSRLLFETFKRRDPVDFIYAQGFAGWRTVLERQTSQDLPPVGVNMHGLEMYQKPASPRARLEHYMFRPFVRKNLRGADVAFTLGGGLGQIIASLGVDTRRIVESPNGVADSWLKSDIPQRSSPITFVFLGRYERRKGIEELHKAVLELGVRHDFAFHFIGPIPEKLQLSHPKVKYWGLIKDEQKVKSILKMGDVLVCPSYSEGMPTVILEAMASGMAVIATNVGAVDALVSRENGWLIAPGNHTELLRVMEEAIHLAEGALYEKKRKGRSIVQEQYLWDRVAEKTIAGIENVLAENKL